MRNNKQKALTSSLIVTIDVEDWLQSTWDHSYDITQRSAQNTGKLLEILATHHVSATMFILGKFAERFPGIVKQIVQGGHEVASHGYGHIEIFHQTPEQFREDARRSKYFLEDLIGQAVVGYRAPDFSVIHTTCWALEVLADLGFQYDSSIFPIRMKHYGILDWPTHPVKVCLPSGNSIVELSISTLTFLGKRWPVAGGGYHRLLPGIFIRWIIDYYLRQENGPFMAYCHPYEFDAAEFDSLDFDIPLKTRLHQGLGRRGFQVKFERMITSFKTAQVAQIANSARWPEYVL